MSSQIQTPEELARIAESLHEQYLRSLRSLHEALANSGRERTGSRGRDFLSTPPMRPINSPIPSPLTSSEPIFQSSVRRNRRATFSDPQEAAFSRPSEQKHVPASTHSEDEMVFIPLLDPPANRTSSEGGTVVRRHIQPVSWVDQQLLRHLKYMNFTGGTAIALQEVIQRQLEIDEDAEFSHFAAYESEGYVSSTFEVYDVDENGHASQVGTRPSSSLIADAPTVWDTIKHINRDGKAFGRITIIQEPSALMLGALHLTMSRYFDMNELINHLVTDVDNKGKTKAYMNRAFISDTSGDYLHQRSFFFVFKYYTVVGHGLQPAPWQQYDKRPVDKRSRDHIEIAECSSVLALSLSGQPRPSIKVMKRRRGGMQNGFVFDTFAPWHMLSVQSFPDDEHTVRGDESRKDFINGPHAFLDALVAEYRDAWKRNVLLHDSIAKLITPRTEFMFDGRERDKLLFEDQNFTYIRRYFWAYNSLGVVNNSVNAMLAAYHENFTNEFWEGRHQTLWPHPEPDSREGRDYRERMAALRHELERACLDLSDVVARNNAVRKEIENLRDQLFSGSSIKESRRVIEQGENIKILTLGSMIFLPLTFVTSVFGMTEFHYTAEDWRFPVIMVCVCVPFIIALILLQTRTGHAVIKRAPDAVRNIFNQWAHVLHFLKLGPPIRDPKPTLPKPTHEDHKAPGMEVRPRRKRRLTVRRPVEPTSGATSGRRGWRVWRGNRAPALEAKEMEVNEVELGNIGLKSRV